MSNFKNKALPILGALFIGLSLASCQVRPLNAPQTVTALRNISVAPVDTRVAQQVRNHLIYGFTGGQGSTGERYEVKLNVSTAISDVIIRKISGEPSASNAKVTAEYILTDNETKQVIAKGKRIGISAFDKTTQSFANLRAQRNAENRAAKEVAEQIRIAIATALSSR